MRSRLVIIVLALAAVAIAFASSGDDEPDTTQRATPSGAANALRVSFAYSPEKEQLLAPLVARFNDERHSAGGRTLIVDASIVASGEASWRRGVGRGRDEDRRGRPAPDPVVTRVLVLGPAAQTTRPTGAWSPTRTRRSCAPRS